MGVGSYRLRKDICHLSLDICHLSLEKGEFQERFLLIPKSQLTFATEAWVPMTNEKCRMTNGKFLLLSCSGLSQLLPAMESRMSRLNSNEGAAAGCRHFVARNQLAFDDGAVGG